MMLRKLHSPVAPSANGTHYERLSRDVVRLDRSLAAHRYRHHAHPQLVQPRSPWLGLLLIGLSFVLFWGGLALLLGWRPVAW